MRRGLVLLILLLGCSREPGQPPPVVVISIDTLRSDHLRAYGYGGTSTPAIDRLAADGIVFERAWSHVPLTLPSHTSLMTGLLPPEHGVRDNAGATLDPRTPTIASLLRARGYKTGGAVSAYVLRATTNINAGFDHFDDRVAFVEGAPTGNLQRAGRDTVRAIVPWLDANARQPFFLFVHLFEPHAPYEGGSYDAEITRVDEAVSELLDAIRIQKRYDDTLIVLTSDHGEGLRDHGEQEHGVLLYREALQVPLIVKLPRSQRRGTRVRESAQLIDILPTIAALTGATPPPHLPGKSLLEPLGARASYAETLYPRIHLGWSDLRSIVRWPMHLIDGPKPELYRVESDPREERNVLDADRRAFTQLRGDLAAIPQRGVTAPRISDEEARKLAALGYVSAGRPAASSNLNPREHLADLDALKTTTELLARGDYQNAATRLEELLARNPGWSDLR
ncbi:MAG TPA: sulfatase, partial [Thermoanaerobaculia bacterium]